MCVFSAGGAAAAQAAGPAIVSARPGQYRFRPAVPRTRQSNNAVWIDRHHHVPIDCQRPRHGQHAVMTPVTRLRPFYSNHAYIR